MHLTDQQGTRLIAAMLAMRPDWIQNQPGRTLKAVNETTGFPGIDFDHCIRALAFYATAKTDGAHRYRTPELYPQHGHWWTTTAPPGTRLIRHECPDHPGEDTTNCRCCAADIKLGQRPEHARGKHYEVTPGVAPANANGDAGQRDWAAQVSLSGAETGLESIYPAERPTSEAGQF